VLGNTGGFLGIFGSGFGPGSLCFSGLISGLWFKDSSGLSLDCLGGWWDLLSGGFLNIGSSFLWGLSTGISSGFSSSWGGGWGL
jgi:hypothetical protein